MIAGGESLRLLAESYHVLETSRDMRRARDYMGVNIDGGDGYSPHRWRLECGV